jgi:hypothetical protein
MFYAFLISPVRAACPMSWECFSSTQILLEQCCTTSLHSRHTKYCRRVMAAHQPHFAYGGGGKMVYGIDWPRQLLINRPQPKNVLFDVHNYPSLLLCYFKYIHYLK